MWPDKHKAFINLFTNGITNKKGERLRFYYPLAAGGVSSGKSLMTIGILDELCQQYSGTRYFIGRKSLSAIKRATIPSVYKVLDMNGDSKRAKINKSEMKLEYKNGSEILFIEVNKSIDPQLNKIKGLECTGGDYEELNEIEEEAHSISRTRVGRWRNSEYNIPPFILANCNPDNNWVKTVYYDNWVNKTLAHPFMFMQFFPADNPFNTKEYIDSLNSLPFAEYQRYVVGNWEYGSDPNQMVSFGWLKSCYDITSEEKAPTMLSIDVAREGDDKSVLCYGNSEGIIGFLEYDKLRTDELGQVVIDFVMDHNISWFNVGVDMIGLGAGVYDYCASKGYFMNSFKSCEKARGAANPFALENCRAEAFWSLREDIKDLAISLPINKKFQKHLLAMKYYVENKCIKIISKKELKKILGESPDYADAAAMFQYIRKGYMGGGTDLSYIKSILVPTTNNFASISSQYRTRELNVRTKQWN